MQSFFMIPTHRSVTEHMADQPKRAAWGPECLWKLRKSKKCLSLVHLLSFSLSLFFQHHIFLVADNVFPLEALLPVIQITHYHYHKTYLTLICVCLAVCVLLSHPSCLPAFCGRSNNLSCHTPASLMARQAYFLPVTTAPSFPHSLHPSSLPRSFTLSVSITTKGV